MLLMVVICFTAFWLPLQTFSMITFLYPEIREGFVYQSLAYNIFIGTYFACHWLSMAHSCLNSLIYCFMNDKFREDLHNLICCLRGKPLAANRSTKSLLAGSYPSAAAAAAAGIKTRSHHYSLNHKPQDVQREHQQRLHQGQAVSRPASNSVRIKFKLDCGQHNCDFNQAGRQAPSVGSNNAGQVAS